MKRLFSRLTPASRIAIGLTSLTITLLLLVDISLNLVPDHSDMQRKIREVTSERLAVQVTSLIQRQEFDTLKLTMSEALARDREKEILSLAVREQGGRIILQAGDHQRHWIPLTNGKSTLTHVQVPIHSKDGYWGVFEIAYTPVSPQTLMDWLRMPVVALAFVVVPVGFLAFYLYIRRSLLYLDPSAAIPGRVKAAFDTLSEGIAITDNAGRIMLCNEAFTRPHASNTSETIGRKLSEVPWLIGSGEGKQTPWEYALERQAASSEQLFRINQPDGQAKMLVKAAPIRDEEGKLRGCMVTFHDVTELHRVNENMIDALHKLEKSQAQLEQSNKELHFLATRDSMTGTLNRRAFYSEAEQLFSQHKQEARDMSCIVADIDFFKKVNDSYGHSIGDQVIVGFARTLALHMRSTDLLCRYGGEEFCIILPGLPEESAAKISERLREDVMAQVGSGVRSVKGLQVTSSFGVSSIKSGAETLSELIELADFALYTSKRAGRNQVNTWKVQMAAANPDTGTTSPVKYSG